MLYTPATKKAMKLCFEAHKDQVDKSGVPYVFHPFHLAEQMQDEQTTVAALLHDVAEDSGYTLEDLAAMGFDEAVINALRLLTHDKRVPYLEYVARLRTDPIARAVKLADLRHNSDLSRPFIILFLRKVLSWMQRLGGKPEKLAGWLIERGYKKSMIIKKYETLGLFLLVAIPLPGTGAWTGALVAALMGLRIKFALPAIGAGVAAAGVIVTLVCRGVIHIAGLG